MRFSATILFLNLLTLPLSITIPTRKTLRITQSVLELVASVSDNWKIVNGVGKFAKSPLHEKERILMSKIDKINLRLEELDEKIGQLKSDIESIGRTLKDNPDQLQYHDLSLNLMYYGYFISVSYDELKKFALNIEDYEKSEMLNFSDTVLSNSENSVLSLLDKIYDLIIVDHKFLQLLQQRLTQSSESPLCLEKSPQQTFYSLLEKILMVNSIGYMTVQSAYMIKKMYSQGNFTGEAEDGAKQFKSRTNALVSTFKNVMSNASKELWKCDPKQHIRGETYVEITGLLQGYILNQVNLEEKEECKKSCSSGSYTCTKTYDCKRNSWCLQQHQECPKIVDCQLIDKNMIVCKADPSSGRRYRYVDHANGRRFGQVTSCPRQNTYHLSSYKFWVFWECDYCFCLCDYGVENRYSDRYVNLRSSMADISKNRQKVFHSCPENYSLPRGVAFSALRNGLLSRVVTGLRFVKHNRIIHLQVQEGKLLPGGQIDPSTVHWIKPENYTMDDKNISKDQDYHVLTYEKRGFDLDTIVADQGSLVTGLRFRKLGSRLDLEVLTTPFNITTGKLKRGRIVKTSMKYNFTELILHEPDIPTRSSVPSKPNTATNIYIRFVNSDYGKDAAQSTVPFFDAQPVESLVPVPLSGVGTYYKGQPGSGGFIAPKIITYDFSQHLGPVFKLEKKN